MKDSKKGVTLVELLVVLAVLVILAAVMIPIVTGVMNKTNEQTDEVSAGLYTSIMQQFANEKVGDALLYPNLTTTGAESEYATLHDKAGKGMFPGYNILVSDNDDNTFDAIRREAVIAIKAFSDTKTLDGYYVQTPTKEHFHYVYYYLTGKVTIEDERTKTPIAKSAVESGVINIEDYWVYLSRDGGSGESLTNAENGTGMVFVQVRQYGTDELLDDVTVTLRIGAESRTAVTGVNGTVGFSDIALGSVYAEATKLGAVSFPDSRFYDESGLITVKKNGYVGDSAANPYIITLKMGSLGSLGFYRRTKTWDGTSWSSVDTPITDNVDITTSFVIDSTRTIGFARNETYNTNLSATGGKQELLTTDGRFLLYGPYTMSNSGAGFRTNKERVTSKIYGIDNLDEDYADATEPYEYPIVLKRPAGQGVVSGTITWERPEQPLKGTPDATGTWLQGYENYSVDTRVVMKLNRTGDLYYSDYFSASLAGIYPYSITGLPDGNYSIWLDTPYKTENKLTLRGFPSGITVDGTEIVVNAQVDYLDPGYSPIEITVTYDENGNYDPIPDAKVQMIRLGKPTYIDYTTDNNGYCKYGLIKRGFYQLLVTPPSYIGSTTYTYRLFVTEDDNVTIRLPIQKITVSGTVSGLKGDGATAMDKTGSFSGLKVSFVRYSGDGETKYSTVESTVTTTGLTAPYSASLVPGKYKIVTSVTCYKDYSEADVLRNFKTTTTHNFSLTVDSVNIVCHPNAKISWKQDSSYHWQECSKCGTVFNKAAHKYSAWTASGASGCYRYCTEPNCNRTLNAVTAHDYQYKATGSYPSTCVTNGNNHYECSRCGFAKNETIGLTGHNWSEYTADNDTTHTRRCRNSGCGATQTQNHSYGDWYWVNHNIEMSANGSYCYSNGCQRADCLTCGHYKLNYPKVGHSIECFIIRQYVSTTNYLNIPTNYSSAFFVTNNGRVYMKLGGQSDYSGRQVWTPPNAQSGGYGFRTVFTTRTDSNYTKSSIFSNTRYSHYTSCGNTPTINGYTYHCYCPINHEGDPYRTTNQCGCANKPLGYIRTAAGTEIKPTWNPAWQDPYAKFGRR